MDRYDWEWGRRHERPGMSSYDRNFRYGGDWWGGGYRGGPSGGGRPWQFGWRDYSGEYGRRPGGWGRPDEERHRYSYPGPRTGSHDRFGRQEPWEPGPPSGYGSQWGAAYGQRRPGEPGPGWGAGYEEYRQGPGRYDGGFGRFESRQQGMGYAGGPDVPPGYFDDYEAAGYYDDEDDAELGGSWGEEPNDEEVRNGVRVSLRNDGFIEADAIQVEVKDRVVTLRGEVKDYMEARYAWDDAWDAPGVRGVISKLTVQSLGGGDSPPATERKAGASTSSRGSRGKGKKKG